MSLYPGAGIQRGSILTFSMPWLSLQLDMSVHDIVYVLGC